MAHHRSWTDRARLTVAVLTASLLVVSTVVFARGDAGRAFTDLGLLALPGLGALNCALAAFGAAGRLRLAWAALAGACVSWAAGEAVWTWYELVREVEGPFPSWGDVGYLGFPVAAVVALAVFPANATRADRRRMTLDGLMAVAAISLVSSGTALGAVIKAGGETPFATAVSIAYPASDIVLLVVCVLVLARSRAHRVVLGILAVGSCSWPWRTARTPTSSPGTST